MARHQTNKQDRVARWERKQRRNDKEQRVRKLLKDRKRQDKVRRNVDQILRYAPNKRSGRDYNAACQQLWDVAYRLKFAKRDHLARPGYVGPGNAYLYAMAQMADRFELWVREPATFKPRSHNPERQFSELCRHLFARYDPPAVFEQAWFEQNRRKRRAQQTWYIGLAQGGSPRRLSGLPIELTRRAAHLLDEVPATMTIEQGLRWAQVRAMDASPEAANAILASPIGVDFVRDAFWLTLVRFLVDQPMLDPNRVGPIVDYIHFQRHEPQVVDVDGHVHLGPPQPNLTMAGRSIDRLLRQVEQWHGGLARQSAAKAYRRWKPSGVPGKLWVEGVGHSRKHYQLRELLDSTALVNEGARMHHCVASYEPSCAAGRSAIFSLTTGQSLATTPLLTIEVRPAIREIVQISGKYNAPATTEQMRMVRTWAQQAGLQLATWMS
jgi:hypothetical protein